jgi:autotransporter-associated beta strand protein
VISGNTKAGGTFTGGITGTGNVVLNNLGLAANTIIISGSSVNHTGSLTLQGSATGNTNIDAAIGTNVTGVTQNSATSTLVLSGNNDYSGATTISAGRLRLGAANVIPDGSGKGNVSVAGTLDLNGFSETVNGLTGLGMVDNTASSPAVLTVSANSEFGGTLKNTGANLSLVKTGESDFTLAGNNTYSGGTTINAGRLFIANPGSLTPNGAVQINNGGGLHLDASGAPTYNQVITLASGGKLAMRKAATLSNVTLPTSGSVIFNNDDLSTVGFSLNKNIVLTGDLSVQVGGSSVAPGDVTLSGAISGNGGLSKTEAGTLILAGANSYTGTTTISAGTLRLGSANVIPDGSGKGNIAVAGTFDLNGFSETINGLSGAGTIDNTAASTPAVLTVSANSNFGGILKNTGASLALVKTGETDLVLTGSNTYSGGTIINAGRLFIANSGALTPNGPVQVNSGGGLHLNAIGTPTYSQSITLASGGKLAVRKAATLANVTLPTSGSVVFNNDDQITAGFSLNSNLALSGDLTVQVGGVAGSPGAVTLAGAISGSAGLVKTQAGALILTGANSYTGDTTVNGGVLAVSGTSIANTGKLVISGGKVDLANTETVGTLFFGAVQQPAGNYTSADLSANFTGSGTLTVLSGPPGFSSWITGTFANGVVPLDKRGPHDDPDNDGISNLVEYAIAGQDPTMGNPAISTFSAGTLSFTKREGATGITYAIESSTLLTAESWATLPKPPVVESSSAISYPFTPGTPVKNFARLKVTLSP